MGIIKTLTERARTTCQPTHLKDEIAHLKKTFLSNGYSEKQIRRAMRATKNTKTESADKEPAKSKAFLQYIPRVTDRIGKLLKKHQIKTIYKPTHKLQDSLRSAKDSRDPKTCGGVYHIPCSCGDVYIGTTKRSANTRIKEHKRHCHLRYTERSAVAQHMVKNPEHKIAFDDTELICNMQHYYPRLHHEAIEIYKHKCKFNKTEEGLKIHKSWYPALKMCKVGTSDHKEQRYRNQPIRFQLSECWPITEQQYACTTYIRRSLDGRAHSSL